MLIVVLGATGNVGAEVVAAATAAGHTVRAVSRSGGPSRAGVEHVVGDLGDATSYAAALDGADALFTLAGYAGLAGTLDALAPSGAAVALLSSSAAPNGASASRVPASPPYPASVKRASAPSSAAA